MSKLSIGFLLSLALFISVSAQQSGYKYGDKLTNFGVGVNSYYDGGVPLSVSYEYGISDRIMPVRDQINIASALDLLTS